MSRATRRLFMQGTAAAALAAPGRAAARSVYARLGVKPVINGVGVVTVLGGSIMPPEVVSAMEEAARSFVPLPELHRKAGERIAGLIGVPAAMVTCGCAAAITVATAASMSRGDAEKIRRLPDASGMPFEVIQQKSHRSGYEAQMLLAGARLVWVETREELDRAIGERTAMMFFLNKADPDGRIKRDDWVRIGKQRGIPTFNDAASDVPPAENLSRYVKEGFDLVAFSGGKGLLGPQCSGLLVGRKDLIDAGLLAQSPHGGIGRGMKAGKEEIVGLVAAIERYMKIDHAAERRILDARASHILEALAGLERVSASLHIPEIANQVPHVAVEWQGGPSAKEVVARLAGGDPPIAVSQRGERGLLVSVWMMRGEE
ncbi:MAG: selenocysteine synthase, partial [Bryobacteraceae bacterium]